MQLPLPSPRCVKPAFVFLAILVLLALNLVPRLTRLPPDGSSPHGLDVNVSFPHTIASSATCSYFPLSPDEDTNTLVADLTGSGYPRFALLNGFPPETAAGEVLAPCSEVWTPLEAKEGEAAQMQPWRGWLQSAAAHEQMQIHECMHAGFQQKSQSPS